MPSDEKFSRMFFFKLGIGAFCLRVRNLNCIVSSVDHYCDYVILHPDRSRLSLVTVPSGKKVLKRKGEELMKIVVYRPPSYLKGFFRWIFRVKK